MRLPELSAAQLQRLADLEARAQRLNDINDIKRLQRTYGYHLDEGQWDDVADLFARERNHRDRRRTVSTAVATGFAPTTACSAMAATASRPGQLNEHLQVMPVITLHADGQHAQGTWRAIILSGQLGKDAWWGAKAPMKTSM